jgi:sodium/bile acid cotransporter 7
MKRALATGQACVFLGTIQTQESTVFGLSHSTYNRPFANMTSFLVRRWFLIALGAVLLIGYFGAGFLEPLSRWQTAREIVVAAVLFLMALPLSAKELWKSARKPGPALLASVINLGVVPLFAVLLMPLLDKDMGRGLLVAAAAPCTLASASVWTRKAGGNDSIAIFVTLLTNAVCFLVTPAWVNAFGTVPGDTKVSLDFWQLVTKLGMIVVLPMALAQIARLFRPIAHWSTRKKVPLGVAAQVGILSVVLVGIIKTGLRMDGSSTLIGLCVMLLAVAVVHLGAFYLSRGAAILIRQPPENAIAVGIAGSQKTLMVGLTVATDMGITILPMVAYHVFQLLVDTVLVDRFKSRHFNSEN